MTTKLTITQLGTPKQRQGAKGPFETNYLKAKEYNNEFLNFFVNKTTSQWKVGDVVEVEAVEKREYTAKDNTLKTSYDIKLPRFGGNADVMKALEEIRNTQAKHGMILRKLEDGIDELIAWKREVAGGPKDLTPSGVVYPTAESEGLDPNNMANFGEDDGLEHLNPDEFQGL